MSTNSFLKAVVVWVGIACLAVVNGLIREKIIAPVLGVNIALPVSGFMLSVIVFVVTYLSFGLIKADSQKACILIGILWVMMTLCFEFIFGHFVANKSWSVLLQNFNITNGDLFILVLLVTLISPYAVARMKGVSK